LIGLIPIVVADPTIPSTSALLTVNYHKLCRLIATLFVELAIFVFADSAAG
jgi:hypothetical protein